MKFIFLVICVDPLAVCLRLNSTFFETSTHPLPKKLQKLKNCNFYARQDEEGYDIDFWKVARSLTNFTGSRSERKIRNSLAQYLKRRFQIDPRDFNFNSYLEKVA